MIGGELTADPEIIYNIQDIFNLLPNLKIEELVRGVSEKSNNMYLLAMVSTVIRATIALHSLINNKINNLETEREKDAAEKKKEAAEKKEAEKNEKKKEEAEKKKEADEKKKEEAEKSEK